MTKIYGTVRCQGDCGQDLTDKAQYYDKGKVYCCECNYRKDGKEWPSVDKQLKNK